MAGGLLVAGVSVFLFGLLIVCRSFRSIVTIVSCFTLAHSLTLALATLNVINLPARWVEPAIAAMDRPLILPPGQTTCEAAGLDTAGLSVVAIAAAVFVWRMRSRDPM